MKLLILLIISIINDLYAPYFIAFYNKHKIIPKTFYIRYNSKTKEFHRITCIPDTFHVQPERLSLETPCKKAKR